MAEREQYYDFQPSFNSGEVSPDVANRTDIDKFRSALLKARNCFVKPYGSVYRRPGTMYVAACKYADKKCILHEFDFNSKISYLLEIGAGYIRVYKDNTYLNVEVATPFTEDDLDHLRFAQSADTLFIASGTHNVQLLQRYTDVDWKLSDMDLTSPYFDVTNGTTGLDGLPAVPNIIQVDQKWTNPGAFQFTAPADGEYTVALFAGGGGYATYCEQTAKNNWTHTQQAGPTGQQIVEDQVAVGVGGTGEYLTLKMSLKKGVTYSGYVGNTASNWDYWENSMTNWNLDPTGGTGGEATFNGRTARGGGGGVVYVHEWHYQSETAGTSYSGGGQGGTVDMTTTEVVQDKAGPSASQYTVLRHRRIAPAAPWVRITFNNNAGAQTFRTDGIWPSAVTGSIKLSSTTDVFRTGLVGACIKLYQDMPAQTVSQWANKYQVSGYILVGKGWHVVTHGKWGGTVIVQSSKDSQTWHDFRRYTSNFSDNNGDFNATESGTVDDYTFMRVVTDITGGSVTVDLTRNPYTHEGWAQIVKYNSAKDVDATVIKQFGSTEKTNLFAISCWNPEYGYPRCVAFFQDRLVLAANDLYPYAVWMSRSGDYYNFSVEKADGKVTDDSAIMLSLVNRKEHNIKHLVAFTDLIVFTDGNEWLISGANTVTPTAINPRVQSSRGCEDAEPILVGGRIVYVQRRGTAARDFAYSYDTDNYDGPDLTILAKHLTQNRTLIDSAYEQDPHSLLFFVTSDGKINVLTYVADQKVYAWTQLTTNGKFENVVNLVDGTKDSIYVVVNRTIAGKQQRFIEYFSEIPDTEDWMDYMMLDCGSEWRSTEHSFRITGFERFAGEKVDVLADGETYKDVTVESDGTIKLEQAVSKANVGLRYTSEIETPNLEIAGQQTTQGKYKKVSTAILRVTRSRGGNIGNSNTFTDPIPYTEDGLFTGDLSVEIPNQPTGGYEKRGRVYIKCDEPYPFDLSSIIRVVSFGG